MYQADLTHSNKTLQEKLEHLYRLSGDKKNDMGFREPFLKLLAAFDNPQDHLPPVIHVAGTNGKGSVVAMLESLLQAHGKKVHRFTSPHLIKYNERIRITGTDITDHDLEALIDAAVSLNQKRAITFFEITTAMAFKKFVDVPADATLLEVGLGGRLDSTNIIPKRDVAILNRISYDHCHILGYSLEEITREKAGIINSSAPVIIGMQSPEFLDSNAPGIIKDACAGHGATPYFFGQEWEIESDESQMHFRFLDEQYSLPLPNLIGPHQIMNAGVALAALHVIPHRVTLDHDALTQGIQSIDWPGRLQKVSHDAWPGAEIFYDGGHNDSAGESLGKQAAIWAQDKKPLHLIVGMKENKDASAFFAPLMPYVSDITVVPVPDIGAYHSKESVTEATNGQKPVYAANSIESALQDLNGRVGDKDVRVLIAGSLYLAQQIL